MDDTRRSVALDALRGFAIIAVLQFHFARPTGSAVLDAALHPFAVAGWAGVDLFFVLSGYLVGGMILREVGAGGTFAWARFAVRRAWRLWPVLYLYLATLALMGADWRTIWPSLFHVQNYAEHSPSHLWSLAVEEHFYLAAALGLPWLARRGPRALFAALVAVIVSASALRIGALALGETPLHAQWQTQYRVDALAMGVLLAAIRLHRPALFDRIARERWLLLAVAVGGFGWLASGPPEIVRWGPGLTVAWIASAALVLLASGPGHPAAARPLAALGRIAYPLYIWHASIGQVVAALAAAALLPPLLVIPVMSVSAILFAWAVHRFVELPFMALRDRPLPYPRAWRQRHGALH